MAKSMADDRASSNSSPLTTLLEQQGFVILDGGLATALERRGHDLSQGGLWSARLLLDNPTAIEDVHTSFFEAGADVVTTATYQASTDGFTKAGIDTEQGNELIRLGVELGVRARDKWWASHLASLKKSCNFDGGEHTTLGQEKRRLKRQRPLVAASVGPYGAARADGSEYRGQYCQALEVTSTAVAATAAAGTAAESRGAPLTTAWLEEWHRPRLELLASCPGVDILACETVPSLVELEALVNAVNKLEGSPSAWISFSCCDDAHLNDGSSLAAALELVEALDLNRRVEAVGVNCTNPAFVSTDSSNIFKLKKSCRCCQGKDTCEKVVSSGHQKNTSGGLACVLGRHRHGRAVVLYPNSGEEYSADTKSWEAPSMVQTQMDASDGTISFTAAAAAAVEAAGGSTWEVQSAAAFAEAAVKQWAPAIGGDKSLVGAPAHGIICVGGCCQTGTTTTSSLRSAFEACNGQ